MASSGRLLIVFVGLFLSQYTLAADHWGYPDLEVTDVFPKWGGICDTGKAQSPIDLSIAGSLKGSYPDLDFQNYDKTLVSPSLVNNGHTVQLSQFSSPMTLNGGPLSSKYVVEQIHLHWWSEHTIDQIRYPMEVHIVHRNTRYANMSVAVNYKDGISVIGILYHVSNEENSAIGKISENINFINAVDEINKPVRVEQKLSVREFFPKLSNGYLTYAGSLTTPSCAESVTWFVLLDTFPVTLEQVNQFKTIQTTNGKTLDNNYRFIQKKNNRAVVVVQDYRSGTAPSMSSSILALIAAVGALGLRRFTF